MKKIQRKDALRNIRKRVVSYLSICLVIMLGLGGVFITSYMGEGINGFSIRQTKGYLTRETVVTTLTGVLLGVLVGAIGTPFIIKTMEQPDLQFIRSFHTLAWAAAVVLEVLFSIVINSLVFRKVKDLNFRDVA